MSIIIKMVPVPKPLPLMTQRARHAKKECKWCGDDLAKGSFCCDICRKAYENDVK